MGSRNSVPKRWPQLVISGIAVAGCLSLGGAQGMAQTPEIPAALMLQPPAVTPPSGDDRQGETGTEERTGARREGESRDPGRSDSRRPAETTILRVTTRSGQQLDPGDASLWRPVVVIRELAPARRQAASRPLAVRAGKR